MTASVKTSTKPEDSGQSLRRQARALAGRALGFRDCPAAVLDELVALGLLRTVSRGSYLVRRGDPHQHAWLVVSGLLEGSTLHANGHRHLLGLVLPGDFVSLMGAVDEEPHSHDLGARVDSVVLGLPGPQLRALRQREPSVVLACERQIIYRNRLMYERLAADPGIALEGRVARMLCLLAQLYGQVADNRVTFEVRLSQADLADWLGLSRQRVNFALKALEAEGLIDLHYSTLVILDLAGTDTRARA